AYSTLTFTAKDKYGNLVGNIADNLKFVMKSGTNGGITIDDIKETGTPGTYTAKLTGTITGDYTIVPEYNNEPVGSLSATVTLTAGAPVDKDGAGKERSTFIAKPTSIAANNSETSTLIFTAKDKYGNQITGIANDLAFDIAIKNGPAPDKSKLTLSAINEEGSSGVYKATLQGTLANVYTITPKFKGNAVGTLSVDVTLRAGDPVEKGENNELRSTFTASRLSIVADDEETSTLTFTAKDKYGNLVGNIADNLKFVMKSGPNSGGITIDKVQETGTAGVYTATLKGTITGDYMIVPLYNNVAVGSLSATVTLDAIELVLSWNNGITSVSVDDTQLPTFLVVVRDKSTLRLIPNKTVTFTLSSNGGGKPSIYPATVKSGADGQITQAPAVSDNTAETVTVTGQISGTTVTTDLNITFTAGAIDFATTTISADPATIVADGKTTSTIHYKPKDGYGNPITSIDASTITSEIIGIDASGITMGGWSFVDGHYQAVLTSGTKIGAIKVIPVINGEDGISRSTGNILTLIPGTLDASQSEIKAIPSEIVANGKSTSRIVFIPRDAAGNFISTLKTETIGQVITPQDTNGPRDTSMSAWSYDKGAGVYVSTLTSGTTIGAINIMPTVNGGDAATIGVTDTLKLIEIPGQNVNIDIAHTDNAIADGVATNVVTVTLTDDNGVALVNRQITVTPSNSELSIDGAKGSTDRRTNEEGKVILQMASTYASWLGSNGFTVTLEGFSAQGETNFSLYVDQKNSLVSLDKAILYNNGTDKLTATYAPVDKEGRAIPAELLPVTFSTTDLGSTQVITQNGLVATVSSKSSPSNYRLSVTMTNYSQGWQPKPVNYKLQPLSGVLLATLEISPKLCGTTTSQIANGMPFTYCTPTDGVDYYHSGLGFVIELKQASPLWDKQLTLHSSTVDGAIYVSTKDGTKTQNCSVPVSVLQSWMNDFGDNNHNLNLSFTDKTAYDTINWPGYRKPNGGGGIGACDYYDGRQHLALKPDLQGSGNVEFEAYTKNPESSTFFSVPLTGSRMDAGKLSSITVNIYAN
ncbi:invasin domain 3-containing protein, partial [Bartonella sp. B10834G3]|uniref:invasin domain 3-containing protein n=3 Tax=Bartonella TaxID=773 RepID=UPI0018DE8FF7